MPAAMTTRSEVALAVRAGTLLAVPDCQTPELSVSDRRGERRIGTASAVARAAALSLAEQPATEQMLVARILAEPGAGMPDVVALRTLLRRMASAGVLDRVLHADGRPIVRLTGEGVLPVIARQAPDEPLALHPQVVLTIRDGLVTVESGRSHLRVLLDPSLVPALTTEPVVRGHEAPWCHVVDLLYSASLLQGAGTPRANPPLAERQWSACDLWFHRRTRESRGMDRYGGTYPFLATDPPPPADPPRPQPAARVGLPIPDLGARQRDDPPLVTAMEGRCSTRVFDPQRPPTLDMLSELLYRSARVRREWVADHGLEVVDRVFPAGGSLHELELYVVATRCDGLNPGMWRYDGRQHALELVAPDGPAVHRLAADARATAGLEADAPLTLVVSARFGRLMWKYETIPYALILKHVGVLYHSLYLNATAIGLGICALGGGSTAAFAAATGTSPLEEGSVGEVVVGLPLPGSGEPQ